MARGKESLLEKEDPNVFVHQTSSEEVTTITDILQANVQENHICLE